MALDKATGDVYKRQTRVRGFTQDDAHIFCTPDQVKEEFLKVVDIIFIIFRALDFKDFEAQISLRDPEDREKYRCV